MSSTGKETPHRFILVLVQMSAFIVLAALSLFAYRLLDVLLVGTFSRGGANIGLHLIALVLLATLMMLFYRYALQPLRSLPFVKRVRSRPLIPQLRDGFRNVGTPKISQVVF